MRPREGVTWRHAQVLTPEDGGGVEDEVAFRTGIEGGGVVRQCLAAGPDGAFGKDLNAAIEGGGYVLLGWTDIGWVYIFSRSPIAGPEDMKKAEEALLREREA